MDVKIRKLHEDARIPQYATEGSAGFDLVACEDVIIAPGETKLVRTGLAFEIPSGYELQIRPRSGISLKTKLRVANSPGTVDADFRGEVAVIIDNISKPHPRFFLRHPSQWNITANREGTYIIRKGDRIAQGVIAPVYRAAFEEVSELSETERGAGGLGSTGVKAEVGVE
jgi:dUTP pyrophosphatase